MDDLTNLVLSPFHEIVEKGKAAADTAGDTQPMLKAAQSLVREGERAIKKIEPIARSKFEESGPAFLDAIRENDEITDYRSRLNDLLWEFDEYIEDVDHFDAEKFTELQALSRQAAPKIYDILMRLKIEPRIDEASLFGSTSPLPLFHPGSLPGRHSIAENSLSPTSPQGRHLSMDSWSAADAANSPNAESSPVGDSKYQPPVAITRKEVPGKAPLPPSPPMINPWDINVRPAEGPMLHVTDGDGLHRREQVPRSQSESPVDPAISPMGTIQHEAQDYTHTPSRSIDSTQFPHRDRQQTTDGGTQDGQSSDDRYRLPSNFASWQPPVSRYSTYDGAGSRALNQVTTSQISAPIPEDAPLDGTGGLSLSSPTATNHSNHSSHPSYSRSSGHSGFGGFEARPPHIISLHHSDAETTMSSQLAEAVEVPYEGLEVDHRVQHPEQGMLIPVESETTITTDPNNLTPQPSATPTVDCSLTQESSFWLAKGFCEGAKQVSKGDIGVKKTKKPVGFTSSVTVARCTSCMCELNFKDIENDVNGLDVGTYNQGGVSYRIRFLQKSHIGAKRVDDVQYGCVFCVQQGHTLDESDATVFFSPKALMEHIARHPRPLPEVPGIKVVDGPEVPSELSNDFDIQVKKPPMANPVDECRSEIMHLPAGTARDHARRLYGQRLLFDRTPALELAAGARITGLTWPAKYKGEWAFGWHDGHHASIPTDLIRLDPPSKQYSKLEGPSMIRARARWRFSPTKDKNSIWLKFDKNDVITNIEWVYFEQWCWSGTNAKGKRGYFPQAFIDTNTLEEPTVVGPTRRHRLEDEMNRSTSLIGKFRKGSQARPPSVAGSMSSEGSRGVHLHGRSMSDAHSTLATGTV